MRKFTDHETDILNKIENDADSSANAIESVITTLIGERKAGANAPEELKRITNLLTARAALTNVSIYIENAI